MCDKYSMYNMHLVKFHYVTPKTKHMLRTEIQSGAAVHYSMILYTSLQWLRSNVNQSFSTQKTPHILPSRVFCEDFEKHQLRKNGTALYLYELL